MSNKKFILNADDFGMNQDFNRAVLEGYNFGFLRNASICANGEAAENAAHAVAHTLLMQLTQFRPESPAYLATSPYSMVCSSSAVLRSASCSESARMYTPRKSTKARN